MYKKIILSIVFITMMITTASASVRPNYVELFYGLEPATWLAIAVGIGAAIQHIGRYSIKKRNNPDMKYDTGYLYTTIVSILAVCQLVAGVPVVELTAEAVMYSFFSGLGINEGVSKASRVVK